MPDPALNENGMTEFHLAAYHGELEWVQNCLRGGLDVHARDLGGYTPLHWVVDMGSIEGEREEIVAALLQAGADVNAQDAKGCSVVDIAKATDNHYLIPLLFAAGAESGRD